MRGPNPGCVPNRGHCRRWLREWGGEGTLAARMVWGSSSQLLSIWAEGQAGDATAVSLHGGCAVSRVE
eukprot:250147-Chlamydomonas_euryale.AAC.1